MPQLTQRFKSIANPLQDPLADAMAHEFAAVTCSHFGDPREVLRHAQAALTRPLHLSKLNAASFVNVHSSGIRNNLARGLWLLGYPDQALVAANDSVTETDSTGHPRTIAHVLCAVICIYLWTGKWEIAAALIEQLLAHVARHRLSTYAPVGIGWQGNLALMRGDLSRGIDLLQRALADLRADGYGLYVRLLSAALAQGYESAGQHELACATVRDAIAWSENHGPSIDSLELLRVKGEILVSCSRADHDEGEACLMQSLKLAHAQSLLSLELRSAISLARLWADRGQAGSGLELLKSIHGRFTEGFGTLDLVTAANLLAELRSRVTSSS